MTVVRRGAGPVEVAADVGGAVQHGDRLGVAVEDAGPAGAPGPGVGDGPAALPAHRGVDAAGVDRDRVARPPAASAGSLVQHAGGGVTADSRSVERTPSVRWKLPPR